MDYKPIINIEETASEKIEDLVREGNILGAQELYFKDINNQRQGLIRL